MLAASNGVGRVRLGLLVHWQAAMKASRPKPAVRDDAHRPLVRIGLALAAWSERWFPDPLVFALAGVVVVFLAGTKVPRPSIDWVTSEFGGGGSPVAQVEYLKQAGCS